MNSVMTQAQISLFEGKIAQLPKLAQPFYSPFFRKKAKYSSKGALTSLKRTNYNNCHCKKVNLKKRQNTFCIN